jgi:hypothetical protein
MAETTVENQICNACGADVRKGALFCYNCGGAVASEIAVVKNGKNEAAGNTQFQEGKLKESENNAEFKQKEVETKQEVREISAKEMTATQPIGKSSVKQETKLKSAATMLGKSKVIQPKRVEVIWEEHENIPNVWFILTAVFLTILAAVILFLAMRLK